MGLFDYRHMTMASVASALTQAKPFRHVLHCATPRMPRFWRRVCAHLCSLRATQCNALQHGEANAIRKRLNIAVELVRLGPSQCEALAVLRLCIRHRLVLYCVALHSMLVECVGFIRSTALPSGTAARGLAARRANDRPRVLCRLCGAAVAKLKRLTALALLRALSRANVPHGTAARPFWSAAIRWCTALRS